jgi:hypothetical protein
MTTPAAASLYEAQHVHAHEDRRSAIFNPRDKRLDELPVIYGFNNGGSPGWYSAVAIAEDGHCLGGHCCSSEAYMPHDLGVLEGTRIDRHERDYQKHYPDGYRMEFVSSDDMDGHAGLRTALERNKALPDEPGADAPAAVHQETSEPNPPS